MRKLSESYIFPVPTTPVRNGIILLHNNNSIADIIDCDNLDYEITNVENFEGFLCPGFVNTHFHLEISHLKNKIPERVGLGGFITGIQDKRKENEEIIIDAMEKTEKSMVENGIIAAGDISNSALSFQVKLKNKLYYHHFIEVFSSTDGEAAKIFEKAVLLYKNISDLEAVSIVPHSPYAVSPALFLKIKEHALNNNSLLTMHHQESHDENLYFRNKAGNINERMKILGIDNSNFIPTGKNSLESVADYLPRENPILLVHNTVSKAGDIDFAMKYFNNPWWCFCPQSNLFIENKLPDFDLFLKHTKNITLGTDSLASCKNVSILEEIKIIQDQMPCIELHELIKWATLNGAAFLNTQQFFGSFEKGKKPGINLIEGVDIPKIRLNKNSKIRKLA